VALCLALRKLGKTCFVILDEKIPDNLRFIENACIVSIEQTPAVLDLAVLLDAGESARLGEREVLFRSALERLCIDHHASSRAIYDYNHMDVAAAAVAELIFELIRALDIQLETAMAEALYVGLVTDTGRFQYTNTTERSHLTAAALIAAGVSPNKIFQEVYENYRLEKIHLENRVFATMLSLGDGKAVLAQMSRDMLRETGAADEETEGIAERLRAIRGVEVSVLLRELPNGGTKASMRSKTWYDVAALAATFGGGGHIRAAGFTTEATLAETRESLIERLKDTLT
jgi:phosphoesterase RecJ-like protein